MKKIIIGIKRVLFDKKKSFDSVFFTIHIALENRFGLEEIFQFKLIFYFLTYFWVTRNCE